MKLSVSGRAALGDVPGERFEPFVPPTADALDPTGRIPERSEVELVTRLPAAAFRVYESGLAQRCEVLGHRLPGDRQLGGELRRRRRSSARQRLDDVAPVRVRERGEERS